MVTATTVKIVRAFLNVSQGEMAQRMGVSASLVSAVENGTKRISPEFAKRFKRAAGITDAVLTDIAYLQHKLAE
ncbi:helix-turn-helix transcriptional regulator [Ectobacillus panaciterrae]|uniref:helix-turn-helix transcriptional regulator n=1 Tax=Ectobacillus panaciterrae TaxID=363872 RepID=UPI000421B2B2|nr:helix-turn-helix transcriptional regulator [Ectobacillus panaciterrae]